MVKARKEFIGLAAAAAAGFYLYLVLIPSIRVAGSFYSQASKLHKDVQTAQRDRSDIKRLEDQEAQLKRRLTQHESKFLDASQLDTILSDISREATDAGAKIAFIEPVKADEKDRISFQGKGEAFVSYPIRLGVKASYHKLGMFINRLETSGRFIKINDISVKADPSDEYNHNVSISMEAFVMKR